MVRSCNLTVALITFYGISTLPPLSPKFHQMDQYEKIVQKRYISENYQVILWNDSLVILLMNISNWMKLGRIFEMFEAKVFG